MFFLISCKSYKFKTLYTDNQSDNTINLCKTLKENPLDFMVPI